MATDYELATNGIRKLIADQGLRAGDQLPTLAQLCRLLGVGRISVQKAFARLVEEGLLETVRGRGTFVLEQATRATEPGHDQGPPMFDLAGSSRRKLRIGVLSELLALRELYDQVARQFCRQHPNVEIEYVHVPSMEELMPYLRRYHLDMFQVHGIHLPYFVKQDWLFNPRELGGLELDEATFYPVYARQARHGDDSWGVPLAAATTLQMAWAGKPRVVEQLVDSRDWWDWCETIAALSREKPAKPRQPVAFLSHALYQLFMLTGINDGQTMEEMSRFELARYGEFARRFQPYIRQPGAFLCRQSPDRQDGNVLVRDAMLSSLGSSSWIVASPAIRQNYLALPSPTTGAGRPQADCAINVIARTTPYPLECRDFLALLAREDVQAGWARRGWPVSHRAANRQLHLCDAQGSIADLIDTSIAGATMTTSQLVATIEFRSVVFSEMQRWQLGETDAEAMLETLALKARFFFRAHEMRHLAPAHQQILTTT